MSKRFKLAMLIMLGAILLLAGLNFITMKHHEEMESYIGTEIQIGDSTYTVVNYSRDDFILSNGQSVHKNLIINEKHRH